MTLESLDRSYRAPWLPQFGLYKYESAEHLEDTYENIPSKKLKIGFLLLCGVLLSLFLVTYFIITDLSRVERVGVVVPPITKNVELKSESDDTFPALVVEMLNKTEASGIKSEESVEMTSEPLNHRSFDTKVEPQKLVFLPSRHLRPPKLDVPVRAKRRRDRPMKRRNQAPKPFNHYMPEPHPAPFKRLPTTRRFYDPNIGFKPYIPGMQEGFRPVVGSFRRPKGTVPSYYQSVGASNHHASFLPTPDMDPNLYVQNPSSTVAYIPDPFHNFKPPVPADVNLLVLDQPSREQHLRLYNEQYLKNAQTLYQQVVKASRQKMSDLSRGTQKHRPFQLMLDVYPMPETDDPTKRPVSGSLHKFSRFSPYAAKYNAFNSINHDKNYDGSSSSYFNRMRFAQIQNKNPHTPYYEHPYFWKINQEGKYVNDQLTADSDTQTAVTGGESPSQLVVHLNLFPKKKKKKVKQKRPTFDYENDSEENSEEQLRRSSDESEEIFLDEETLNMTEKKYNGRPLRSTKSKQKKSKSDYKKETDDSSPIAINFNFPTDATKKANCSHEKTRQKFIPMMDANDNDVFPTSSVVNVPKAHDYPYRFASMPPAHIKSYMQRPVRHSSHRFQRRMLKTAKKGEKSDGELLKSSNEVSTSVQGVSEDE